MSPIFYCSFQSQRLVISFDFSFCTFALDGFGVVGVVFLIFQIWKRGRKWGWEEVGSDEEGDCTITYTGTHMYVKPNKYPDKRTHEERRSEIGKGEINSGQNMRELIPYLHDVFVKFWLVIVFCE